MLVEVDLHTSGPLGDEVGAGSEGGRPAAAGFPPGLSRGLGRKEE